MTYPAHSRPVTFALILLCVVLLAAGAWSSMRIHKATRQLSYDERIEKAKKELRVEDLKVSNKTHAFRVTRIEKSTDGRLHLFLTNEYAKRISAYQISIGSTMSYLDYLYSEVDEDGIAPSAVHEVIEPINPEVVENGIVVLAVMFEDGSGDGNKQAIKEIEDYRLGGRVQAARVLPALRRSLELPNDELEKQLDKIKLILNAPEEEFVGKLSERARIGFRDMKTALFRDIGRLQHSIAHERDTVGAQITKKRLSRFIKLYEAQ